MATSENRVAITGIGMINSLGCCARQCWEQMLAGRSGITHITQFDASECLTQIGGQLPADYAALEEGEFSKRLFKQTQTTTRLGILCAKEAMADSGFTLDGCDPHRCAVITGSGQTGYPEEDELLGRCDNPGKFSIIQQMANAMAAWISINHGFKGPAYNVATACASGSYAIAAGYEYLASGRGDVALAVGADAMLSVHTIKGFNQLAAISQRNDAPAQASRPFDLNRDGFVLANGGAALLLERESAARRRGARIYAILAGAALCSEAYNIVAPKSSGEEMAYAMRAALADARLAPDTVGYISAHGTSTTQNDADETAAVKLVFGPHARRLAISSQKSMTGHTVGGAGAIEAATTALILYHRVLTPTINYETPDPACDLDYVANVARPAPDLRVALSNSFGFGGHNATLAFLRAE